MTHTSIALTPARRGAHRTRPEIVMFTVGAAGIVTSGLIARSGTVGAVEAAVFRSINGLPNWLYPVMWPLEQAGNLAAGLVVALAAALIHRRRLALAALIVTLIDVEGYVKHLVPRERPGATSPGAILRGDVPAHGLSFPSGHVILTTALAVIVTPHLRGRWRRAPWIVVAGVGAARIYVGAHNPLDVPAGVSLGLMIGVLVHIATFQPAPLNSGRPSARPLTPDLSSAVAVTSRPERDHPCASVTTIRSPYL
jgi:membrane-associated phospholipid phosphatase